MPKFVSAVELATVSALPNANENQNSLLIKDNRLYYSDGIEWFNLSAFRTSHSTGYVSGGSLSINVDNTKFDVSAMIGVYVDNANDRIFEINYTGETLITPTFLATNPVTYIGVNTSGIIQSENPFTSNERRSIIPIGVVRHLNNTSIDSVDNNHHSTLQPNNQLLDFINATNSSFLRISGNVISPAGSNLNINKSAGELFKIGINSLNDLDNPNSIVSPLNNSITFKYRTATSVQFGNTNNINPNNYDNLSGGLIAVPADKVTVQRVYILSNNDIILQAGQHVYDSIKDAKSNLANETFTVEPDLLNNALLLGYIIVKQGSTNLSDPTQAEFINTDNNGNLPIALSGFNTLQDIYDNSNIPQILTNSSGPVIFQSGQLDTSNVFEIKNTSGTTTFSLKADGSIEIGGNTVWHAGNDGAGSGLDADTIDGLNSTDLALVNHTHVISDIVNLQSSLDSKINLTEKGANSGVASLDSSGLIPTSQLPPITITNTTVAVSEAAMLATVAQTGDVVVRSDLSKSFILRGSDPSVLADWEELLSPVGVSSIIAGLGLLGGTITSSGTIDVNFAGTGVANFVARSDHNHDAAYLGVNAKAADTELFDGFDSSVFARTDILETFNDDVIISNTTPYIRLDESDTTTSARLITSAGVTYLQVGANGAGATSSAGTLILSGYNGGQVGNVAIQDASGTQDVYHEGNLTKAVIDALNVDADTLDGFDSSAFARLAIANNWQGQNQNNIGSMDIGIVSGTEADKLTVYQPSSGTRGITLETGATGTANAPFLSWLDGDGDSFRIRMNDGDLSFGTGFYTERFRMNVDGTFNATAITSDYIDFTTPLNPNIDTYRNADTWVTTVTNADAGTRPINYMTVANFGFASTNRAFQIATAYGSENDGFYIRRKSDAAGSENGANAWQNWKQIMTKEYADTLYAAIGGGGGGGGNADTLDGIDSTGFIQNQYLQNIVQNDANASDSVGVKFEYLSGGASNKPTGTDHALMTLSYSADWSTQMASDWRTNNWYVRTQNNTTWGSWDKIITDGNSADSVLNLASSLKIIGDNTGDTNSSWIGFYENNGSVRQGYVGLGSSGTDNVQISAETGNVELYDAGSKKLNTTSTGVHVTGELSATSGFDGVLWDADGSIGGRIYNPIGASFVTSTASHTGAIKITLPVNAPADMLGFTVHIFDYALSESIKLHISGYCYQGDGANEWVNTTVQTIASLTNRDFTVRFGHDGTNNCLWIGETNSTWSYPQIFVTDFHCGFSSTVESYKSGWDITIETSFGTIDDTHNGNFPVSRYALDSDLLDGISSANFARLGTTSPPGNYLYTWRDSVSSALYVRQAGTGPIARFFQSTTSAGTDNTSAKFEILNNGGFDSTGTGQVDGDLTVGNASGQNKLILNNVALDSNLASRIEFRLTDNQHIQIRHNSHDSVRAPFGIHIEKTADNASGLDAYLDVEGAIYAGGDVLIGSGSTTNNWLTLHGADGSSERTGISIGESGKWGSASLHLYYTGDGYGHIGMGTMSASTDASYRAMRLHYQSTDVEFYGQLKPSANNSGQVGSSTRNFASMYSTNYYISNNTRISEGNSGDVVRITTPSGYVDVGPQNTGFCHFSTDRTNFYFNKQAHFDEGILMYNTTYGITGAGVGTFASGTDVTGTLNYDLLNGPSTSSRDKLRVYGSSPYAIGMVSGMTYGALNSDWAMTFQMNNDNDRGFWWGDDGHSNAQGAMSLTTNGKLTVAAGIRVGYGETTTTIPTFTTNKIEANGAIAATGDVIAFASDERLKTNIVEIDNALEQLDKIRSVTFDWDRDVCLANDFDPARDSDIGVIAQDLEAVDKRYVTNAAIGNGFLTVRERPMIGLLIGAVKELKEEKDQLKTELDEIKQILKTIQSKLV